MGNTINLFTDETVSDSTYNRVDESIGSTDEILEAVNKIACEKRTTASKARRKIRRNLRRLARPEGNVVNGKHEKLVFCYALGVGIRTALLGKNTEAPQCSNLQSRESQDLVFRPEGSGVTPPHDLNHVFKLKVYSPSKFKAIRRNFGVSETNFVNSICGIHGDPKLVELMSNAQSGAFLYSTSNGRFVIKTMTRSEAQFLNTTLLDDYQSHILSNPKCLLTRFLGMFRVKIHHLKARVYFVVMGAIFNLRDPTKYVFDLKGSSLGRSARPGEKVAKDNDLREAKKIHDVSPNHPGAFAIELGGPKTRAAFLDQALKDVEFLHRHRIIDYSLMLGVVDESEDESKATNCVDESITTPVIINEKTGKGNKKITVGGGFSCFRGGNANVSLPNDFEEDLEKTGSCTEEEDGTRRLRLSRPNSKKFRLGPKKTVAPLPVSQTLAVPRPPPQLDPSVLLASESETSDEDEIGSAHPDPSINIPAVTRQSAPLRNKSRLGHKSQQCFFGIIDILGTEKTKNVKMQLLYKSKILGYDRLSISCVDSKSYRDRFMTFLKENITA